MHTTDSERGGETARPQGDPDFNLATGRWRRGPDRRDDDGGLFAYQGPERRSSRDRRVPG